MCVCQRPKADSSTTRELRSRVDWLRYRIASLSLLDPSEHRCLHARRTKLRTNHQDASPHYQSVRIKSVRIKKLNLTLTLALFALLERSPAKTEGEQHNSQRLGTCCSQGSSLECRRVDFCQIQDCSSKGPCTKLVLRWPLGSRPRHIFREALAQTRNGISNGHSSRSSRSTPPCAPQVVTMAVTDAGAAHGVLMVISFIFLSEFAEVIGWYASNKVCGYSSLRHTRAIPCHLTHQR